TASFRLWFPRRETIAVEQHRTFSRSGTGYNHSIAALIQPRATRKPFPDPGRVQMNRISRLLAPNNVLVNLSVTSKKRLFDQAGLLFENSHGIERSKVADALLSRERVGSTGLGEGVPLAPGRINRLRAPNNVLVSRSVTSKKRLFEQAGLLFENSHGIERSKVADALLSRERLGSTGLGEGVAIPHGRIKGLQEAVGAVIRLATPVPF